MLDEVDVVTHIEPITDAIKSLEQKLGLFTRLLEKRIDSTIQKLEMRIRAYDQALDTLLDRSKQYMHSLRNYYYLLSTFVFNILFTYVHSLF
ncbi:hypothetical protein Y032_0091g2459 [Ancylostoma ceylanicum]|uniref:Uncharacterized protein n=1 Tax=Ancylostoma ceylanicum TaxID=53326 RepID=A0A016TM89_9BILA|nr:hypothetical protein Y032_0091g2459 [Ancylostoma ceylanicum]